MINLCIDIGNSSVKWALFQGREMMNHGRTDWHNMDVFHHISADRCIVSSTIGYDTIKEELKAIFPETLFFDSNTPIPLCNDYHTPGTLGPDRLAAAIGAYAETKNDILIIDAGTAITYDFVSADGHYKGGNISPGMRMRFEALHEHTAKLPLIDEKDDIPNLGYDTETAIRSGVILGIKYEIEHYINDFILKFPNITIYLTGGEKLDFDNSIKNRIFADYFIVLKGLNEVLLYNKSLSTEK